MACKGCGGPNPMQTRDNPHVLFTAGLMNFVVPPMAENVLPRGKYGYYIEVGEEVRLDIENSLVPFDKESDDAGQEASFYPATVTLRRKRIKGTVVDYKRLLSFVSQKRLPKGVSWDRVEIDVYSTPKAAKRWKKASRK